MKTRIHHTAIRVTDLEWYTAFFQDVFGMTVEKTRGEKPARQIWFYEGIQLIETKTLKDADGLEICDHISLGVDIDPVEAAKTAISRGCSEIEGKGAHWFALPNLVQVELKPYP